MEPEQLKKELQFYMLREGLSVADMAVLLGAKKPAFEAVLYGKKKGWSTRERCLSLIFDEKLKAEKGAKND